jgi:pimeloyl-ACP methyl ester carboxylesterase
VLDGAMDPSLGAEEINRQQTGGFDTAFEAFAEDCVQRSDCPLGEKSADDAAKRLKAFFRKVDAEPLKTDGSRTVTESLATTGVVQAMYTEVYWPRLREALTDAMDGDGTALLDLSDGYYEREPDGSYANIMFANPSVNCLDLPPAFRSPEDVRKAVPSFEKASSVFGRGFAWAALNCAYWDAEPTGEPHRVSAKNAAPVLVVGTVRDPATPYGWAEALAGQMETAELLTYDGDGHTAFLQGSDCVDTTISDYLVDGDLPKGGKRCS